MTDFMKNGFKIALVFSMGLTTPPSMAQTSESPQTAVWTTQNAKADMLAMLDLTGLRAGSANVPLDYYVDRNVKLVFNRNVDLRTRMPKELPNDFNSVVSDIQDYIEKESRDSTEQQNGLSDNELSRKIVRASFCFGTDAKMAAAKIRKESVFAKKAVSPTGAVGLSQLTGIAIEEVNDQLGNRGNTHAPKANTTYFRKAIRCYLGRDLKYPWTVGVTTAGRAMSKDEITRAKNWIKKDVDRDLIYGHILLKLYLAVTKSNSSGTSDNYAKAFIRYNGDNARVGKTQRKFVYSKEVMGFFQNIDYRPESDPQLYLAPTAQELEQREAKVWDDVYEI